MSVLTERTLPPPAGPMSGRRRWPIAVADLLFPAARAGRLGPRQVLLGTGGLLAGTALSLVRQPGAGALDTMWAEDGHLFLDQAVWYGPAAFANYYAGYYHLVPRIVAACAAVAPASLAPAVIAICAALFASAAALLVYVASGGHFAEPLPRLLVSVALLAEPVASEDVLNSIANLHWYGLVALFWVLIWTPRRACGRVVGAATVVLATGSDILALVYLPLLLAATRAGWCPGVCSAASWWETSAPAGGRPSPCWPG